MRSDPPFPTISFVLSQHAQSPQPAFLVFPWTSVTYTQPVVQLPQTNNPIQTPPPVAPTNNTVKTPKKILRALQQFIANLVAKLKARFAS